MSYTIRDLIRDGITWIIRHPRIITISGGPIVPPMKRNTLRPHYDTMSGASAGDFDAALIARMKEQDTDNLLAGMTDSEIQSSIDSLVPDDEDLTDTIPPLDPGD